jgi:hypothetical protein
LVFDSYRSNPKRESPAPKTKGQKPKANVLVDGSVTFCETKSLLGEGRKLEALSASINPGDKKMKRTATLILMFFTVVVFSGLSFAQGGKKKLPREAEKIAAVRTAAVVSKRLSRDSPEVKQALADKKFQDAGLLLATSGEMFEIDSAQLSTDGEKSEVSFNVVDETTKAPGQYRQLVYSFDGKDAVIYFGEQNERYVQRRLVSGGANKLQWPPPTPQWWPSSWPTPPWPGSGGGTIGFGGGFNWGDWHEVSIDECHFTFVPICSPLHAGKMRQEERVSKSNPSVKQTRWILLRCGCI